ncbi:MAG: polysaccharide pyruvyl transferase family protein [Cyanobacteria bacterium P01_H01_bin.162]
MMSPQFLSYPSKMKIYHYKPTQGFVNFGDDLNPWLWSKLLPGIIDNNESQSFVGIGTLINDHIVRRTSNSEHRIVFGTGVGYGKSIPKLDSSFHIYCLRGPLSAKALGVSSSLAIVDGAFLARQVYQYGKGKKYNYSYMPHFELLGKSWKMVCEELGFGYIDPRDSVENVLDKIDETEILLAEAMHGSILADAFRIPWIPIVTTSNILPFKWQDWCNSIGLEYQPNNISRLHDVGDKRDLLSPLREARGWLRRRDAAASLKKIATTVKPYLSTDKVAEGLTEQLSERLDCFRADYAAGKFASD